MAELALVLAGASVVADHAGVLWLPQSRTLVVADLHLEKGSSFARRGMMLPPYDTASTLLNLAAVIMRRAPRRIIALGDSFHDRYGYGRLTERDRTRLAALQRGRDWIWISGNHDRVFAGTDGELVDELEVDGLTFRHEPRAGDAPGEVAGHLHPAAKVRGRGRSVRCRAFATDGRRMVLPAFGVLAGGLNVLDRAFHPLFTTHPLRAILLGQGRLFPIAAAALAPD